MAKDLVTDCLGFPLNVKVVVDPSLDGGQHKTHEDECGNVRPNAEHCIRIAANLKPDDLIEVAAHEVYHLFYSVRHLISVDEETESQAFGQLVRHVCRLVESHEAELAKPKAAQK